MYIRFIWSFYIINTYFADVWFQWCRHLMWTSCNTCTSHTTERHWEWNFTLNLSHIIVSEKLKDFSILNMRLVYIYIVWSLVCISMDARLPYQEWKRVYQHVYMSVLADEYYYYYYCYYYTKAIDFLPLTKRAPIPNENTVYFYFSSLKIKI